MKLSQSALNKIAVSAKLGKSADIQSAIDKALEEVNAKRPWQDEVNQWASVTESYFSVTSCYHELGAVTVKDKAAIRQAFIRLKHDGIIEPWKRRGHGWYRRIENEVIDIDWQNADENPLEIKLPLELDKMVNLYNGDIFVIAGESNAGKSAMCLNIVELNMPEWDCHYFSSELGGPKLKKRIGMFDTPAELWKMPAHQKQDNYHDVLFPDALNIIDFLMITDEHWKVGNIIKEIHIALKETRGIAIVAIQKDPNKKFGRGGDASRELASLYITLSETGWAKIIKLKDPKTEDNPNGEVCNYELENGSYFKQKSPWHPPDKNW